MTDFETLKPGWYLVKSKVRDERRAVDNLENQAFEAYCPEYLDKGKSTILFPGYLFLRLGDRDMERYHKIRSTRGITGIVTFNKMSHKRFKESHGCSNKDTLQELLPNPIPGGDKIINQIEEIILFLNDVQPAKTSKPASYNKGDTACHKNPLYEHLKFTFLHGTKNERGLFLVEYIEKLRKNDSIEERVISKKTMDLPFQELEKA